METFAPSLPSRLITPLAPPAPAPSKPANATAPASGMPAPTPPVGLIEELLRQPAVFVARAESAAPVPLARALLASVALGGALFGAALGAHRGGVQLAYCAVKLPLVLVGTMAICAPAFVAIARAAGSSLSARGVIALSLGASARFALVLAGLAPVLWLLEGWLGEHYHALVLATVLACAMAGCAAGALLFRGLVRAGGAGVLAGLGFALVYALVGGQTAWLLRPYVLRPQTAHAPFVRPLEGDLAHAVETSLRSAQGRYEPGGVEFIPARARSRVAPVPAVTSECSNGSGECD